MKRFLLAPALAALVMFVFGAVYWMSPFPYRAAGRVADDAAALKSLDAMFPSSGVYLLPGRHLDAGQLEALLRTGPAAEIHIVKGGMPMMDPMVLLQGYIHEFLQCAVLAMLLVVSGAAASGFGRCARVVAVLAVLMATYPYSYAIWWHHALAWESTSALYDLIAFFLAGLVLAKLVADKPVVSQHRSLQVPASV